MRTVRQLWWIVLLGVLGILGLTIGKIGMPKACTADEERRLVWIEETQEAENGGIYAHHIGRKDCDAHLLYAFKKWERGFLVENLDETNRLLCVIEHREGAKGVYDLYEIREGEAINLEWRLQGGPDTTFVYCQGSIYCVVREAGGDKRILRQEGDVQEEILQYKSTLWHTPALNKKGDSLFTVTTRSDIADNQFQEQSTVMMYPHDTRKAIEIDEGEYGFWIDETTIGYEKNGCLMCYDVSTKQKKAMLSDAGKEIRANLSMYTAQRIYYVPTENCIVYGTPLEERVLLLFLMDTRKKQWTIQSLDTGKHYNIGEFFEWNNDMILWQD